MSRWRFAVIFAAAGAALIPSAFSLGGPAWLALWPGVDFVLLAAIYGANRPEWLGKRADGRMGATHVVVLGAYFLFTWAMWHLFRRITSEPACHEVAPGMYLGRRPLGRDLPGEVNTIIDLTAEFPRPRFDHPCAVLQLPTLDAQAPPSDRLGWLIDAAAHAPGALYVHCAAGHGRSALVTALVLVRRGVAADLDAAIALLQAARPAVRLHAAQERAGRTVIAQWQAERAQLQAERAPEPSEIRA